MLRPGDAALVSDLTKLELDEPVDAVFSTAVFHWILDHDALFARMRAALEDGGRFAAQCGGEGNIDAFRRGRRGRRAREPYATHLGRVRGALELRRAEETEERLRGAGFTDVRCWLEPWPVDPPEPTAFTQDGLPRPLRRRAARTSCSDQFVADVLATQGRPADARLRAPEHRSHARPE